MLKAYLSRKAWEALNAQTSRPYGRWDKLVTAYGLFHPIPAEHQRIGDVELVVRMLAIVDAVDDEEKMREQRPIHVLEDEDMIRVLVLLLESEDMDMAAWEFGQDWQTKRNLERSEHVLEKEETDG